MLIKIIKAAIRAAIRAAKKVASIPGALLAGLVPGAPGSVPLPPEADVDVPDADRVVADVVDELDAGMRSARAAEAVEADPAWLSDNPVGATVHAFALGDVGVDLDPLSDDQVQWLLGLTTDQRGRLAVAGPDACRRAAEGEEVGVAGVPPLGSRRQVARAPHVEPDPQPLPTGSLKDRLLAYKRAHEPSYG